MGIRTTILIFIIIFSVPCKAQKIITGAENTKEYLYLLKNKKIAICGNQTSIVGETHLVDFLIKKGIDIKVIFSPEHGFRGEAEAGEIVKNKVDKKTNIPIISLYGKNKSPQSKDLQNIDIMIFDLQDVGVRFYTYISTLHYIMEACEKENISLIVLDRPNPNAHYIDGPVLEKKYTSFVGMHPVPVVYGMTIGEYAKMINGEGWLKNSVKCNLMIIKCKNYTHQSRYNLPIDPSPNLPNELSINLYPSLCFFEGTNISIGRGTTFPFQVFGSPYLPNESKFSFVPKSNNKTKNPKHNGKKCYGYDLREKPFFSTINLEWLKYCYKTSSNKDIFFNSFFNKLSGNSYLQQQIKQNKTSEEIKKTWKKKYR